MGLYLLGEENSRWLRVAASSYFIIWSLYYQALDAKVNFVLLAFLVCDISLVFYEIQLFNFITFIARSLTFFLLILIVAPKIRAIKYSFLELLVGIFVIAVNIFLLFELLEMVPEAHLYDNFEPAYLGFTILTMVMVGAALTYNNRYTNTKSSYFLLAALFLSLSDVNFFIAFYLETPVFYYPDRFLHILSLGMILLFWIKPLDLSIYNNIENQEA